MSSMLWPEREQTLHPALGDRSRGAGEATRMGSWLRNDGTSGRRVATRETITFGRGGAGVGSHPQAVMNSSAQPIDRAHDQRLATILDNLDPPKPAADLIETLFPFEFDGHQLGFAMGEVIAHLNRLVRAGEVRRGDGDDGIVRYRQARPD